MPDTLLGLLDSLINKIKDFCSFGVTILAEKANESTRFAPEHLQGAKELGIPDISESGSEYGAET